MDWSGFFSTVGKRSTIKLSNVWIKRHYFTPWELTKFLLK